MLVKEAIDYADGLVESLYKSSYKTVLETSGILNPNLDVGDVIDAAVTLTSVKINIAMTIHNMIVSMGPPRTSTPPKEPSENPCRVIRMSDSQLENCGGCGDPIFQRDGVWYHVVTNETECSPGSGDGTEAFPTGQGE